MAKRFTDSTKWSKPFLRGLKAPYKLLWLYILDECDHAGIWQVDFEVAQVKIGERLNIDTALQQLYGKIYPFENGEKWFIPDFIEFQYGVLNPENRAHFSVIQILNKYNLSLDFKPLNSPLIGAKDKDKEKDMDKVKANNIEPKPNENLNYGEADTRYVELWSKWIKYKYEVFKFKYKSLDSEQSAFNNLVKDTNGNYEYAEAVVLETIASGKWEGITFTAKTKDRFKDKISLNLNVDNLDIKKLAVTAVGENINWAAKVAKNNPTETQKLISLLEKEKVVLINGKFTYNGQ